MITPCGRGVVRAIALAVALMLLAVACGDGETATPAETPAPTSAPEAPQGGGDADPESAFPVTIDNCGVEVTVDAPPERAVTMNQAATEVMLALGLEDHMIGTAYLDDEILPEFATAYAAIPVLSDGYPSTEALFDVEPDFVYGSYASAFREDAAGERDSLSDLGIATYLSIGGCPTFRESGEELDFEHVFGEIRDVAAIFGVSDRAEELIVEYQAAVDAAEIVADGSVSVMWWDGSTDAPSVGACCGAPGMMMRALGLDNLYGGEAGSWANITWEQVVADDPDVIVLIDAEWDLAADKLEYLRNDPALADLTAVREERTVVIPFSATTPGVRNAPALATLAEDIRTALG